MQSRLPWLYDPPPEIFTERYSSRGEAIRHQPMAYVVGSGCRKLLVSPHWPDGDVHARSGCLLDPARVRVYLSGLMQDESGPQYVLLSDTDVEALAIALPQPGRSVRLPGLEHFLGAGWYRAENWGVWSRGHWAELLLPCGQNDWMVREDSVELALDLQLFQTQTVIVSVDGNEIGRATLEVARTVRVEIPTRQCASGSLTIELAVSDPASPRSLGLSGDPRLLGVGLIGLTLSRPRSSG